MQGCSAPVYGVVVSLPSFGTVDGLCDHLGRGRWYTFMFILNMSLKMTLCCSLIITLITRIPDTFMFRLNMCLKITLCCSLIITLITRILDTFMFRSVMFH